MRSIHVRDDGVLVLDGTLMPNAMVVAAAGTGGKATYDSQQHEGGSGADHVFDGWEDWTLKLRLELSEEHAGGKARYEDLSTLRAAQRALDGELPVTWLLTGAMPEALGVRQVLLTAIDEIDDSAEEDSLWLTLTLLETDPVDNTIQQQAAARAGASAAAAEPAPPALSADEQAEIDVIWGGE